MFTKTLRLLVPVLLAGIATVGCTSSRASVAEYNRDRQRFTPAATATAKQILKRIGAAGIQCTEVQAEVFDALVLSYTKQDLPLPLGSASCVGPNDENLLVEVFAREFPNADTFITRKRELICQKAKDLGRLEDGTSGFDGIPYVKAADDTWLVEPDSRLVNQEIAKALHRPARDACAGIK